MLQYRASYARRRAHTREQVNRLAELVSEGWSISAAGRSMGITQQRASQIWQQVKAEMGAQAV